MHRTDPTAATRRRASRARWVAGVSGVVFALAGPGCKSGGKLIGKQEKPDLLEAELRTREREVLEARGELMHLRSLVDTYQRQGGPYAAPCPPAVPGGLPYGANSPGPALRDVTLGNGTGGRDDDNIPGDEGLIVVIVPKDDDGTAVKATGHATVTALEVSREGLKRPIGKWEVPADQLRRTWKSGLIGSGYFVPLQWDRPPTTDRVRVQVRFVTPDGREYEADRDAKVTPLPGLAPRTPEVPLGPPTVLPPPAGIPPEEVLPPPAGASLMPVVAK